jgi:hypothetical protein
MEHDDLQCRNLPTTIKNKVLEKLTSHQKQHKQNFNLVGQLNNCIEEINISGQPGYQNYFETVDRKAGTDWTNTFPELVYAN